jgi:hypothetical protein
MFIRVQILRFKISIRFGGFSTQHFASQHLILSIAGFSAEISALLVVNISYKITRNAESAELFLKERKNEIFA